MKNFEFFVMIFGVKVAVYMLHVFHQAPQVVKESRVEQEKDIGDSQELLWTSGTYALRINYFTYLHLLYVGDIRVETYAYLGHTNTFAD